MICTTIQDLVIESVDRRLSVDEEAAVASHVVQCADCRRFLETQRRLDRALTGELSRVRLSPEFARHVRERIHSESVPMATTAEERRRAVEDERARWLTSHRRRTGRVGCLQALDGLGLAAVLGVAGVGLFHLLAGGSTWRLPGVDGLGPLVLPSVLVAAAALAAGAGVAMRLRGRDLGVLGARMFGW